MFVAMWMACGLLTVEPDTVDPVADVGDVVRPDGDRPQRGDRADRPDRVLGSEGMDDVHFGMDRAEVEAALGHALYGDTEPGCHYLTPKPEDEKSAVRLMFDEGKLRRIDVTGPAIEIEGGGHVGMQADEIRKLYPGLVEQPHKYEAGALYLIVDPPAVGDGKVIFETSPAGRVKSARAGIEPNVSFVEGCS
jgi:hypothetical protein